jgi:hypothetical protein
LSGLNLTLTQNLSIRPELNLPPEISRSGLPKELAGGKRELKPPGPGTYTTIKPAPGAISTIIEKLDYSAKGKKYGDTRFLSGSSMFQKDIVPNKQRPNLVPGPGAYDPSLAFSVLTQTKTLPPVSSVFRSQVNRGFLKSDAPGPCFYNPKLPVEHRNFRLRGVAKIWV